jgi:hypothetical protein
MRQIIFSCLFVLFLCFAVQGQSVPDLERATLRGLRGFVVDVEGFDDPAANLQSASEKQIQTDVELRIRKAGIQLSTEKDWANSLNHPAVVVNLHLVPLEKPFDGLYAFNITVKVMQDVHLIGRTETASESGAWNLSSWATTWDKSITGATSKDQLGGLRAHVRDLIDQFINDYLAANSKR